jgi:hypothetical protein
MAKKASQSFQWSREARRVQVLGGGHAIRISDHHGLAWTLIASDLDCARNLQRLLDLIRSEDAECAERILDELPELWRERAERNLEPKIGDEDEVIR